MKIKFPLKVSRIKFFIPYDFLPVLMIAWIVIFMFSITYPKTHEGSVINIAAPVFLLLFTVYVIAALVHYRKFWMEDRSAYAVTALVNYIRLRDGKAADNNEPVDVRGNRQSLALIFEDMDRTMFINMHNLRLNTSPEWNAKERFWYEYYDKFINNTLKRLFLDDNLHKMSREELRKNLKREARSVYDLNNVLLAEKAGLEKLKAEGKENDPVAYVQNMMSVYGSEERREAWRDLIKLNFKDSLRERVEELIDEVFDNPDEVRKGVDYHWSDVSLCAFRRQLDVWVSYSKKDWRDSHPAEWVEEYLK